MSGKSKTSRREEKSDAPFIKIIIGAVSATVLYFVILAAYAAFALKSGAGASSYMPAGIVAGIITGLMSGFAAVRPIKQKGALYGALSGLLQALLCTVILFIVNQGSAGNGIFILSAVIIVCGMLGGIAAVNMKKKKKY